jgi:predicted chitinase
LQEFKVSNKSLVAAIIATILVYAPKFEPIEEQLDDGIETGNRMRYRGRGYLELTGLPNYMRMSERLGLGARLVDSPEDANSPEVASRILVAWFADNPQILRYLTNGDIEAAWARVVGRNLDGTIPQFSQFSSLYNKVLSKL